MKHFYFFGHKGLLNGNKLPFSLSGNFSRRIISFGCMVFAFFITGNLLSQNAPAAPFNESFWNGYADKLQLNAQDRAEFMSSQRRRHLASQVVAPPVNNVPAANKPINPNNNVFNGPCINADFEQGNLTGWVTSSGFHPGYDPLGCCPNPNGQQTIMTGAGNDPYGGFPVVYPGGSFSLRLGNNGVNGEADRIEQTFQVSPSNANFSYKYAVVFEDPNHPANEQPFFEVEMLNAAGNPIPCTAYYVAAGAGIPGFFNSPTSGVIYKPWSTVLVDLTPFMGQNVTIRFSTYDCSLGGHFGYAYIDGVCQSFSSGGSATVCAGASTTFCAPTGVDSYTWNGPGLTNFIGQCATASAAGVFTVNTTLFTGCPGPVFTYTLVAQTPPVANAGSSPTVCANNATTAISGSITGFPATAVWSSGGSGVFTSSTNLNTQYIPSNADKAAGTVTITLTTAANGMCPAAIDRVVINITPSPSINAGTGGASCNTDPFALNGAVTAGAVTGNWSTSGNGAFTPLTSALNATYTPGPADIAAGSVTLTLTSTSNGNCFAGTDTVIISIRQPATIITGPNQALCSTTPTISVPGFVLGTNSGIWSSSGPGAFSPSNTFLNSVYSIAPSDIAAGEVTFTLTSTNNGPCPAVSDSVKMVIIQPSTVTAGPNQFLCSSQGSISLSGLVSGFSNTGNWTTTGTGAFNPGATSMTTAYVLTPADMIAGLVTFSLTSTGNGPCPAVSDSVRMRVRIPAIVNSGINQSLCSNTTSVNLSGTVVGGSSTGIWSATGAGGFAPTNTALSTAYAITPGDVALGSVIFTLTSTNNGPCAAVQDSVKIPIVSMATVSAGPSQSVCSSGNVVNLSGSINSPSNTVSWSSGGAGPFVPSPSVLTPTYNLTVTDVNSGFVTFTVTSTNNGPCPAVSSSVMVTVKRLAIVSAGAAQNICSASPTVNLNGAIGGGATTASWTSSGTGNFVPSNNILSTAYQVTAADIITGNVIFTLTSMNNGACAAVNSTMMAGITKMATVSAGPNLFVCSNTGVLPLAGSSPSNPVIWTTFGNGVFTPGATSATTSYSMTASDINAGVLIFTITSTQNGACPAARDTVKMNIMKLASVNAGVTQSLCSSQGTINLAGTINGGGNGRLWTSSGSGALGNANALNTSYVMTPQDIAAGVVTFTLSSQNSTPCPEVTSTVSAGILLQAVVLAGPSQTICSSDGSINLSGSITGGAGSVVWTSSGTGSFSPGNNSPVTSYNLSATDMSAGTLNFNLTSTNNGNCVAANSNVIVVVNERAKVNAGTDKAICSSQLQVPLQGVISGVTTSGIWTTNGAGTFTPNAASGSYSIAPGDVVQGAVQFVLASLNNGVCPVVTDTMKLVIESRPAIAVAPDTSVCDKSSLIALSYTSTSGPSLQWTTTGSGVFLPNSAPSATHYSLSTADKNGGNVSLMLGTSSTGPCGYTGATMKVKVMKGPRADFSASTYVLNNPGDAVQFTNLSTTADTYTWTFGDGTSSLINSPGHNYADVGYYQVTLSVLNSNGCRDVTDKQITVIADVQFATAFTPNGNGSNGGHYDPNDYSNDVFFPFAKGVVEYDMTIFNRWGELIFKSNDINIGWDGYFNGQLCQQDTYVWKVNMGFFDGRKYNKTGSITLLR